MAFEKICEQIYILAINNPNQIHNFTFNIYTDNIYVKNAYNGWLDSWIAKNWRTTTGPVAHKDLWERINFFRFYIKAYINVYHVKAHTGVYGNEMADRMAGGEIIN